MIHKYLKISYLLVFFLFLSFVFDCKKNVENSSEKPATSSPNSKALNETPASISTSSDISDEIVESWVPEFEDYGWYIQFMKDGSYTENFEGEGCGGYKGHYTKDGQKIKLIPEKNPGCLNESRKENNICYIKEAPDSLYSSLKLVCGKEEFFSKKDERKDGEEVKIGSIEVVIISPKGGYVTNDVIYFRKGPGKNFDSISCSFEGDDPSSFDKHRATLPKETSLYVIARTKTKEKIDKHENYWYYVSPQTGWYSAGCKEKFGWVYGEFIEKR
ncbi:MAG: hypothetical protein H7A23_16200 [Leptospiraceae bacterium]|nr:hypothetical protein [Leptospiraceae bacterium]MCP5496089.1 hypothetical protein [Leptospiraceae bacterium]